VLGANLPWAMILCKKAEHAGVPMPAASLVHDHLVAMMARGWSGLDWSALGLLAAVEAGLNDGR
jgi:3-hydroxyisobutyrate dehydrogenase-like beta-hydroxyacid dehydrogenase